MIFKYRTIVELLLVVIAAIYSISFWYVAGCRIYNSLGFDDQALLTWDFTASLGLRPYIDIFYPYSALYFFRNSSVFVNLFYFLIVVLIFLTVFFALKKIWKQAYLSYIAFGVFWFVVSFYLNVDSFVRYGLLLASCILLPALEALRFKRKYLRWLLLGLLPGIVFSLAFDQGILCVILVLSYLAVRYVRPGVFIHLNSRDFFKAFVFFVLGFLLGILPLMFILIITQSFPHVGSYLSELQRISLFAKIPYTHSLRSPINLFSFAILLLSVSLLVYKFILEKAKFSFLLRLQICLTIVVILLEQKSIVRSIEYQLTIFSLLLSYVLFSQYAEMLFVNLKSKTIYLVYFILWLVFFVYVIGMPQSRRLHFPTLPNVPSNNDFCIRLNESAHNTPLQVYRDVLKWIQTDDSSHKALIYSFPGDPIFYILNDQRPPYYFSTYEASSLFGSEKRVKYLQNPKVHFVIINLALPAIADEVPEYIRSPIELKYILTNFSPVKQINNFLLLKRTEKNVDIFSPSPVKIHSFLHYLSDIDIKGVPRSEGIYKSDSLHGLEIVIKDASVAKTDKYLKKNPLSSKGIIVLVFPTKKLTPEDKTRLTFTTENNLGTNVAFNSCHDHPCVIRLDNIPLFYSPKKITGIAGDGSSDFLTVLRDNGGGKFW